MNNNHIIIFWYADIFDGSMVEYATNFTDNKAVQDSVEIQIAVTTNLL